MQKLEKVIRNITDMNPYRSILYLMILSTLIGCQKPNTSKQNEHVEQQKVKNTHDTSETSIPTTALNCDQIDTNISKLKKTYSPEDLIKLNKQFKNCSASVPLKKRYEWLEASNVIYENLCRGTSITVSEYLTNIGESTQESNNQEKQKIYEKLSEKEKYLVNYHKELYLEKYYIGEGEYILTQTPQYHLDIFSPYLNVADQIYLKQLRKEYTGRNYILDAGLAISFNEVADRLIFWEKYLKQYPRSYFISQVKELIRAYRSALFEGDENTRVVWYHESEFYDKDAIQAIKKLANTNSHSSELAKKFLTLIEEKKIEWEQLPHPVYQSDLDSDYNSPDNIQRRENIDKFSMNLNKRINTMLDKETF